MIPYSCQDVTKDDIRKVREVLKSNFLTQGPMVKKFEKAVSIYCNVSYAVAVNSATSALHIACLALDLGPEDWIWTSPNTFVASANCARYCGAKVDFVDIDPKTYNMSIEELTKKLILAEKKGRLPKIIIPVHFAGQPCEMLKIYKLSKRYGFKIIEDASHAIGAKYNNFKVGSCIHSDIVVFSFHPVKIITTGEGGMALTKNKKLADRMRRLSSHGITREKSLMKVKPKNEIWNFQQIELGFNYRMSDIHAALGLNQMRRLDQNVMIRNKIAKRYDRELKNLSLSIPWQLPNNYSSYHLYTVRIKKKKTVKSQKKFYEKLLANNIGANIHYIPVHLHPYYKNLGFRKNDFPEAEQFFREIVSLPLFPTLKRKQQDYVIKTCRKLLA